MITIFQLEKSNIYKIKIKFFLSRAILYSSFLLIPVWISKLLKLSPIIQILILTIYSLFMCGQWYLLGKEIDHRFKIFYKINSSIDRIIYRVLLGKITLIIYFGFIGNLSYEYLRHLFWGTWIVLGLFYSWPTRGKIIEETITNQLVGYKFLDSFEKTLLFVTLIFFFISFPNTPQFHNVETLKLFLDPGEHLHSFLWNFVLVNYLPFFKLHSLYKSAIFLHFYLVITTLVLFIIYSLSRYFFSRRMSLLHVFSLLSAWSFVKIVHGNPGVGISVLAVTLSLWGIFWIINSSTYRSGLFFGLIGLFLVMTNINYFIFYLMQLLFIYHFCLQDKNFWYKRQFLKYNLFGLILALLIFLGNFEFPILQLASTKDVLSVINQLFYLPLQKGFFILSILGFFLFLFYVRNINYYRFIITNEQSRFYTLFAKLIIVTNLIRLILPLPPIDHFTLLCCITFFSIIPLELIFQNIKQIRSHYNIYFAIYILISLFDSHLEGRIKNIISLINN